MGIYFLLIWTGFGAVSLAWPPQIKPSITYIYYLFGQGWEDLRGFGSFRSPGRLQIMLSYIYLLLNLDRVSGAAG